MMGWTTPATGIRCANEAGEEQDVVRAGESLGDIGGKVLGVGPQRDLVQAHGQANRTRMVCDHFRQPFTIVAEAMVLIQDQQCVAKLGPCAFNEHVAHTAA